MTVLSSELQKVVEVSTEIDFFHIHNVMNMNTAILQFP